MKTELKNILCNVLKDMLNELLLIVLDYCDLYSLKPKIILEEVPKKYGKIYIIEELTNNRIIGMTEKGYGCIWNIQTGAIINKQKIEDIAPRISDICQINDNFVAFSNKCFVEIHIINLKNMRCNLIINLMWGRCGIDMIMFSNNILLAHLTIGEYYLFEINIDTIKKECVSNITKKIGYNLGIIIFTHQNHKIYNTKLIKCEDVLKFNLNNKQIYLKNNYDYIQPYLTTTYIIDYYIKNKLFVFLKNNCIACIEKMLENVIKNNICIYDTLNNKLMKRIIIEHNIRSMISIKQTYLAISHASLVKEGLPSKASSIAIYDPFSVSDDGYIQTLEYSDDYIKRVICLDDGSLATINGYNIQIND
jgi:hypothetical protein